ncbi:MAG: hypothetical protein IKN89_05485, partial [Oscillospiraceae bacterium]|nr:hypothetical protein [Oscillospiraceae bacterium]
DCAVRIFVRLSENRGEYFLYWPRFSDNMTEHYASKMRAENCAVLPKLKITADKAQARPLRPRE